jgi:hypothetical protein
MPKIGNPISAKDIPCDRCHSKRKVAKKWKEKVPNASGYMVLEHVQIVCTNKQCQIEFEKKLIEEEEKRIKLKEARTNPNNRNTTNNSTPATK